MIAAPAPAPSPPPPAALTVEQVREAEDREGRWDDLPQPVIDGIIKYIDEYKQPDGKESRDAREARLRSVRLKYLPNPMLRLGELDIDSNRNTKPMIKNFVASVFDILILDPHNLLAVAPFCPSCKKNTSVKTTGFLFNNNSKTGKARFKVIVDVDRVTIIVARKCECRCGGPSFQTDDPASINLFRSNPVSFFFPRATRSRAASARVFDSY